MDYEENLSDEELGVSQYTSLILLKIANSRTYFLDIETLRHSFFQLKELESLFLTSVDTNSEMLMEYRN